MEFLEQLRSKSEGQNGFTLIELLIVIAILLILGTILVTGFKNFQTRQALELSTKEVRQMFEAARSRTLASEADTAYGVYIDTNRVVSFSGSSYSEGAVGNVVFELDPRVTISNVSLSPTTDEVLFTRGTGEPSASGSIELSLSSDPTALRIITITGTGIIYSNE